MNVVTYDVFKAHPHLKKMLEFSTEEEICDFLCGGATFFATVVYCQSPVGIVKIEALEIGVYDGDCRHLIGTWIYYIKDSTGRHTYRFVNDFTYHNAKAIFSTFEKANAYYAACMEAFYSDGEWRRAYLLEYNEGAGWQNDYPNPDYD